MLRLAQPGKVMFVPFRYVVQLPQTVGFNCITQCLRVLWQLAHLEDPLSLDLMCTFALGLPVSLCVNACVPI